MSYSSANVRFIVLNAFIEGTEVIECGFEKSDYQRVRELVHSSTETFFIVGKEDIVQKLKCYFDENEECLLTRVMFAHDNIDLKIIEMFCPSNVVHIIKGIK